MSAMKTSKAFQNFSSEITEEWIAKNIGKCLQDNFPKARHAIKLIARETGADTRAVWNWYNGLNPPNSLNLILLAYKLPCVAETFLHLCGRKEIWNAYQTQIQLSDYSQNQFPVGEKDIFYSDIFVGINLNHKKQLNQRQLWFIKKLQLGLQVKASDIVSFWKVSNRTAERDIADMYGVIEFKGSKKAGKYILANG